MSSWSQVLAEMMHENYPKKRKGAVLVVGLFWIFVVHLFQNIPQYKHIRHFESGAMKFIRN